MPAPPSAQFDQALLSLVMVLFDLAIERGDLPIDALDQLLRSQRTSYASVGLKTSAATIEMLRRRLLDPGNLESRRNALKILRSPAAGHA